MHDHPFADELRAVIAAGAEEAHRLDYDEVESVHLLLALLDRPQPSVASCLLRDLAVSESALRVAASKALPRSGQRRITPTTEDLPYAATAKRALEYAMTEAHLAGRQPVDTGHLLLGMLHQRDDAAALALTAVGVRLEELRGAMSALPAIGRRE
jgi:ATP-dependent Clp protease ATP-binding subunit ClpA